MSLGKQIINALRENVRILVSLKPPFWTQGTSWPKQSAKTMPFCSHKGHCHCLQLGRNWYHKCGVIYLSVITSLITIGSHAWTFLSRSVRGCMFFAEMLDNSGIPQTHGKMIAKTRNGQSCLPSKTTAYHVSTCPLVCVGFASKSMDTGLMYVMVSYLT